MKSRGILYRPLSMDYSLSGHRCVLSFDRDTVDFARGFEAGRIWAKLQEVPSEPVIETVHAGNAEILMRMAEATGRHLSATELEGDWLEATFGAERCRER